MANTVQELIDSALAEDPDRGSASIEPPAARPNQQFIDHALGDPQWDVDRPSLKHRANPEALEKWGLLPNFANALLLGAGMPLMARANTASAPRPTAEQISAAPAGAMYDPYAAKLQELHANKAAWEKEHPTGALATETLGSIPGALGAAALGQSYVAAPIAARAASLAPRLAEMMPKASRILGEAFGGGVQGAASGAATSGLNDNPLMDNVKSGAAYGAFGNPLLRGMGRAAGLESHIAPEALNAADALRNQGINVRPGSLPGANWGLRMLEWLQGNPERERQFYNRMSGMLDNPSDVIDTPWVNATKRLHGGTMEDITLNNKYVTDAAAFTGMQSVMNNAKGKMSTDNANYVEGLVKTIAEDIVNNGGPQGINGKIYHDWVKKGGVLDNAINHENSSIANSAKELKSHLEGAWERTLPQGEAARWNDARQAYKFTSGIDDQLKDGSAFDPRKLITAVNNKTGGDYTKARWNGPGGAVNDIGELAHGATALPAPGASPHLPLSWPARIALGVGVAGAGTGALHYEPLHGIASEMWHNPTETAVPLGAAVLGSLLGGKLAASRFNSPAALWRNIEAMRNARPVSHFGGANPLLPALAPFAPRGEERQ